MPVAREKRLLGRFDAQVNVVDAVGRNLVEAQPVEYAEYHQRRGALGRRRHVIKRAETVLQPDRSAQFSGVALQVGQHERAAELRQVAGDRAREFALVKIGQSVLRELAQGRRERRLFHHRARCRNLAIDQKASAESRHVFQFGEFRGGVRALAFGHHDAVLGVMRRVVEQARERQLSGPVLFAVVECQRPAGDRPRNRVRGERPAHRNRADLVLPIEIGRCASRGAAARIYGRYVLARFVDQPEAVAADAVHMRIDD